MKKTKSMIYTPSTEARELTLYTENNALVYQRSILPVLNSLKKHIKRGVYDREKAIIAFYHVATDGSREYARDFGYSFSVRDRYTAAVDLLEFFSDELTD